MKRNDGRSGEQIRPVDIKRNYIPHAEGSALISVGKTIVICTASIEEKVPSFLEEKEQGWITAEYAMLPRATHTRGARRAGGRTQEIQRLISRSLRSVVDLKALPPLTIFIDADVIQADGGTRTASITGSFVALYDALLFLQVQGKIKKLPIKDFIAAISVGIVEGQIITDLNYDEDSKALVDMNVVGTESKKFVEIQGTAEKEPFTKEQLDSMLALASSAIQQLIKKQKEVLEIAEPVPSKKRGI